MSSVPNLQSWIRVKGRTFTPSHWQSCCPLQFQPPASFQEVWGVCMWLLYSEGLGRPIISLFPSVKPLDNFLPSEGLTSSLDHLRRCAWLPWPSDCFWGNAETMGVLWGMPQGCRWWPTTARQNLGAWGICLPAPTPACHNSLCFTSRFAFEDGGSKEAIL